MVITLANAEATEAVGADLWRRLPKRCLIFLHGPLGAGKTTLVRGLLRAAGYLGAVKSPTYTLVEEYSIDGRHIYHFDLYRVADPEELEWIGIGDYLGQDCLCLIEWPEMGTGMLPEPDLELFLSVQNEGHRLKLESRRPELKKILKVT